MNFSGKKILLIGDVMLDRYVYGDVKRISPEAPVPVIFVEGCDSSIGAAANCARNITALGGLVTLISVVGDDDSGTQILEKIAADEKITPYVLRETNRASTLKIRYLCDNHQLLRVDTETSSGIRAETVMQLLSIAKSEIPHHDVVVLSDYDKGVLTRDILLEIINYAKIYGKPVVIDPKKSDWSVYSGATVVTPNLHEWFVASGKEYSPDNVSCKLAEHAIENILVTRSKQGMTLVSFDGHDDIPAIAKYIIDVTGAGDTAVAVLALGMAAGLPVLESARIANTAAGIVVGKPRTATLSMEELTCGISASVN